MVSTGGVMENFYAVVRQLKAYQCAQESSRNAVGRLAWAETLSYSFFIFGVTGFIRVAANETHAPYSVEEANESDAHERTQRQP